MPFAVAASEPKKGSEATGEQQVEWVEQVLWPDEHRRAGQADLDLGRGLLVVGLDRLRALGGAVGEIVDLVEDDGVGSGKRRDVRSEDPAERVVRADGETLPLFG